LFGAVLYGAFVELPQSPFIYFQSASAESYIRFSFISNI